MNKGFTGEIYRILLLLLLSLGLGLVYGYPFIALALGSFVYLVWTLWNLSRFADWLSQPSRSDPPAALGLLSELSDTLTAVQRRQRREQAGLQAVIRRGQETTAALRDGIVLLNRDMETDWFNAAAKQLLGLRHEDLGNSLFNYIRHPRFRQYVNRKEFRDPLDLPAPQNEALRQQYVMTQFGQGEYLLVVRDITRVHKLEQMRKDFVANLSHELKTPLTVIRGYVETIGLSEDIPERWRKALQQVEQQTLRMNALIEDLTELSKLETNENLSTHRPVMLKPLLEQVVNDTLALSDERGHQVTLHCPEDIILLGNEKELQSAFSNLTYNAVKYSMPATEIRLRVRRHPTGLLVSVKDRGPGIETFHVPRLTERFYRVEASRNASTGGTGLGLAIVKHVMIRHGGRLNIRSKPGKGSTFTCLFPTQKIVPPAAAAEAAQSFATEP